MYIKKIIFIIFSLIINFLLIKTYPIYAAESTTIDLTGLVTGEDVEHQHIYERKYNDNQHWEECFICHDKNNIKTHNLTSYWKLGKENCAAGNYKETYCTDGCGYNKIYEKPHNYTGIMGCSYNQHWNRCTGECSNVGNVEKCYKIENGKKILLNCNSFGTCIICKTVYNSSSIHNVTNTNGTCEGCGLSDIINISDYKITYNSNNTALITMTYHPGAGVILGNSWNTWTNSPTSISLSPVTVNSLSDGSKKISTTVTFINNINKKSSFQFIGNATLSNGRNVRIDGIGAGYQGLESVCPDRTSPNFTKIDTSGNGTSDNFSQKATITATVTETQDNIVYMRLLDKDKTTVISDWGAASKNGSTFTKIFDIVAEIREPSNLYVEAKDTIGNTSIKEIQVQYIDAKAPTLKSYEQNNSWSKSKNISFITEDMGSGNVQIGFNSPDEYNLAVKDNDSYSRNYEFIGDVYSEEGVTAALYLKDAIGNQRMEKVNIKKLDNTAPTITKVEKQRNSNKVDFTITANDINKTLNQEGSGVNGYAITTTTDEPDNSQFQESNVVNAIKNGTYYIWVKDLAGNKTLHPTTLTVNELDISIKVNMIWEDNNNEFKIRPNNIDVNIYKSGEFFTTKNIKENNTSSWSIIINELPKYDPEGNEYVYTIKEDENNSNLQYFYEAPIYDQNTLTVTNRATYIPVKDEEKPSYRISVSNNIINGQEPVTEEDFDKIKLDMNDIYNFGITLKQLNRTIINTGTELKETYQGYTGKIYNGIITNKNNIVFNNLPAGKYEVCEQNLLFFNLLQFEKVSGSSNNVDVSYEEGKYYIKLSGLTGQSESISVNIDNKINVLRQYNDLDSTLNLFKE